MKFILMIMIMSNLAFAEVSKNIKDVNETKQLSSHQLAIIMSNAYNKEIVKRGQINVKSEVDGDFVLYIYKMNPNDTTFKNNLKISGLTLKEHFIYRGYEMFCKNPFLIKGLNQRLIVKNISDSNNIIFSEDYTKESCDIYNLAFGAMQ